jgi:hypothetical protein
MSLHQNYTVSGEAYEEDQVRELPSNLHPSEWKEPILAR